MPRIIAGEFRSRRLLSPPDDGGSRPYLDYIKESVFNLLRGWFENAKMLDLFAGVGTVGLEAVSRGAASVLMVEKDARTFKLLEQNIEELHCADRATAMHGDALAGTCLLRAPRPLDLVFIDPPFELLSAEGSRRRIFDQMARCREIMAPKSFLVLRAPPLEGVDWRVDGFAGPEEHTYGKKSRVLLYMPAAVQSDLSSSEDTGG